MSVVLADGFWQELGVTQWNTRPGFLPSSPQAEAELPAKTSAEPSTSEALAPAWVLIGDGLSAIWQNENHQAWWLWRNMLDYHLKSPEQVLFFDTEQILGEEAGFEVIEQLIELGVETVFSMNPNHELHHSLAEAIQLITLPSFDQMLEQPQLKRQAFISLEQIL